MFSVNAASNNPARARLSGFINLAMILREPTFEWRGRFSGARLYDELRTALTGQIRPEPLFPYSQSATTRRKKQKVNESPRQPRKEPAHSYEAGVQDNEAATDDGYVAFVEITKWRRRGKLALTIDN